MATRTEAVKAVRTILKRAVNEYVAQMKEHESLETIINSTPSERRKDFAKYLQETP